MAPCALSVVVPAYNPDPRRLRLTLTAIRETAPSAQLIVVDDGSHTPVAIPEDVLGVELHRLPENRGPAAALNVGYGVADGALIARCDVGDLWYPEPKRGQILATGVAAFSLAFDELEKRDWRVPVDWRRRLARDNYIPSSTTVVHRSVWETCRFDESLRYADDWDWHARVEAEIGWTFHRAVTGTATCWPEGHTRRVTDPERRSTDIARVTARVAAVMDGATHSR